MSSIPFFARRKLYSTFNIREVGWLRATLQGAGVGFVVTQDSRPVGEFPGYGASGPVPHLGTGAAPSEYTVYVHRDGPALAESAIQGTVGQRHRVTTLVGVAALFLHMFHVLHNVSSLSSISAAGRS